MFLIPHRVLVIPSVALFVVGHAMINAIDGIVGGLVPRGAHAGQCLLHPCIIKKPTIYRMDLTSVGLAMVNDICSIGAIL